MDTKATISRGRKCIDLEIEALQATRRHIDENFADIAELLQDALANGSKLIFSGIGKNAHICEKLVGTFNSIGAPSCFLDPVRALHGDLGLCQSGDCLLAFSNKGETEEMLRLVPIAIRFELSTIAVTSNPDSSLASLCQKNLLYSADKEACPLDLVPTASTTASIAIGDALAMALMESMSVSAEDFARFHPGGSIGRTLAPRVENLMRGDDRLPVVLASDTCRNGIDTMTKARCGCIIAKNEDGALAGVLTDGDIRRLILKNPGFLDDSLSQHMTREPIAIKASSLAAEALKIFETHSIDDLIVVDASNRPIGVIDGQDLTKARLI